MRFAVCSFGCAAGALLALSSCCSAACHAHAVLYASRSPPAARVLTLNSRISECTRRWSVASSCGLQFWLRCRRASRSLSLLQCCMPRACTPVCKPLTSRRARAHFEFANFTECTRGGGVYQCRRSSSSSKQNQVHQQLMQLKSPATATAALATPPARARAHFEFANIFANFKVYKVHAACCYPDGGCTR